jgi:hypothetical protein
VTDEQPAAANEVGSVAFDAADRLAIINVLGAYAYTYDQDPLVADTMPAYRSS